MSTTGTNRGAAAAESLIARYRSDRGENDPCKHALALISQIRAQRSWQDRHTLASEAVRTIEQAKIDVDDLVENYLGLRLEIRDLTPLDAFAGSSVFGLADLKENKIAICERAEAYEPLYRATALHEVGHFELERKSNLQETLHYAPCSGCRPQVERDADDFMIAMALPWRILELSVLATAIAWNMDVTTALMGCDSKKARWMWHQRFIPDLSSRMAVSKYMIVMRLVRRRVISQETANYHLSTGSRSPFAAAPKGTSRQHVKWAITDFLNLTRADPKASDTEMP